MDLNHIFLFVAVISPLLVLARAWRPGGIFRGWRVAAIVVLAITGIAWFLNRAMAGYVGGGAWFVLLFLPAVGLRKASQFAEHGRYESALRLTRAPSMAPSNHPSARTAESHFAPWRRVGTVTQRARSQNSWKYQISIGA